MPDFVLGDCGVLKIPQKNCICSKKEAPRIVRDGCQRRKKTPLKNLVKGQFFS